MIFMCLEILIAMSIIKTDNLGLNTMVFRENNIVKFTNYAPHQ